MLTDLETFRFSLFILKGLLVNFSFFWATLFFFFLGVFFFLGFFFVLGLFSLFDTVSSIQVAAAATASMAFMSWSLTAMGAVHEDSSAAHPIAPSPHPPHNVEQGLYVLLHCPHVLTSSLRGLLLALSNLISL